MATAQMAMGGTDGVLDIIPRHAITIGMQELLAVKRFHLTFMRSWHAGLWRRAVFGEVSSSFPGSLIQLHPNVGITMTAQAAAVPRTNTSQETGEQAPAPGTSA
jgi:glucosamine-6-phosphate deaminase